MKCVKVNKKTSKLVLEADQSCTCSLKGSKNTRSKNKRQNGAAKSKTCLYNTQKFSQGKEVDYLENNFLSLVCSKLKRKVRIQPIIDIGTECKRGKLLILNFNTI